MRLRRFVFYSMLLLNLLVAENLSADVTVAEGANNIFAARIARNAAREPMLQVNVENALGQPAAVVTGVTITAGSDGTGNDVTDLITGGVELIHDKDRDGFLSAGDDELGSGTFSANNGFVTINGFALPVAPNAQIDLLILYTLNAGATLNESFRARVAQNADIVVVDQVTSNALGVSGAPVEGFLRAVGAGTLTFVPLAQNPDGGVAIPNRPLLPLMNFDLFANNVEDITIDAFNFSDIGSVNVVTGILPGTVRAFVQDLQPTNAAAAVASGSFTINNGLAMLPPNAPLVVPRNGKIEVWATADLVDALSAPIGSTYRFSVITAAPIEATGATSGLEPASDGDGFAGPLWTFNYNPILFATQNDPGAVLMPPGAQNYPALVFRVQNDPVNRSESAVISEFTFHASGTMHDVNAIDQVELYLDNIPRGQITAADTLLGTGNYNADNGAVTINFAGNAVALPVNGQAFFVLGYDLNDTPLNGQTARASLLSRDDMAVVGDVSLVNGSLSPAPFHGFFKTVGQPTASFFLQTNENFISPVVAPGAAMFPLLGFQILNGNAENLSLNGLNLEFTGPLNELDFFTGFELWYDQDGDGVVEAMDMQFATGNLTQNGGDAILDIQATSGSAWIVPVNQNARFTLYAGINPAVLGDATEVFNMIADVDADVVATGANSNVQFAFITPVPPFNLQRTIRNPRIVVTNYNNAETVLGNINSGYGMGGLEFNVPGAENLIFNIVRCSASGSLDDSVYINSAALWNDTNKNYTIQPGAEEDSALFTNVNPFTQDNGIGVIDVSGQGGLVATKNLPFRLTTGFFFSASGPADSQAQFGKNCTFTQAGTMVIEGIGELSGRPIEVVNAAGDDQVRTLQFSKGTLQVSQQPITRTEAPPNSNNNECFSLLMLTDPVEEVRIDLLTLTPLGTLDESVHIKPGGIKIYVDVNKNGELNLSTSPNSDYLFAVMNPPATDNGPITLAGGGNTVYTFPPQGMPYDQLLFTVDLATTAPEGSTIQFSLQSTADLMATGAGSHFPFDVGDELTYPDGNPPLIGPVILVQRGAVELVTNTAFMNDADNQPVVRMTPNTQRYDVMRISVKATPAENVELNGFTIAANGSALEHLDLAPLGVELYQNSIIPTNRLSSGSFNTDNGVCVLTGFPAPILLDKMTLRNFIVTFSGSGTGALGADFDLSINGAGIIGAGASSGLPIQKIKPEDPYLPIPVEFGAGRLVIRAFENDTVILPIPTGQDAQIQRLRFDSSRTEAVRLENMTVSAVGTADESTAIDNGALIMNRRIASNPPVLIGSAPFLPGDNGAAALRDLDILINTGTLNMEYSLDVALLPSQTVVGTTFRFDLPSTGVVRAVGVDSGADVEIIFEDLAGGDNILNATSISGRVVTLSSGRLTINKGPRNPPNLSITGSETNLPLAHMRLTVATGLEAINISQVTVCETGTADAASLFSAVRLYTDVNNDGQATGADILLGTGVFDGPNGMATFSNLDLTLTEGQMVSWLLVGDLNGGAPNGLTVQAGLCIPLDEAVIGTGAESGEALQVIGGAGNLEPTGALYTIAGGINVDPADIVDYLLGITTDPTNLNVNGDAVVDVGDVIRAANQ